MEIRKSGGMRNQNQDTLHEGKKAIFNKREKQEYFKKFCYTYQFSKFSLSFKTGIFHDFAIMK